MPMRIIHPLLLGLLFALPSWSATRVALAVLDLSANGVATQEADALSERFRTEMLASKKYLVVERKQMQSILQEQGFQQTGCTKADCAVEAGQLIGVDVLLTGSVTVVQGMYFLSVRLLDVESGAVLRAADDMKSPDLKNAMDGGVKRVVAILLGDAPPPTLTSSDNGDTTFVSNAAELIAAIRSNAIIALNPGTYNLSKQTRVKNRFVTWTDNYDGKYPIITGVENLTLLLHGNGKAEVLIDPAYGWVIEFRAVKNITLRDLTFGHTSPGSCMGGVLRFEDAENIQLNNLDLFGSGTYGLELSSVNNLTMQKSTIRDCTYGLMVIDKCDNIRFMDSEFLDTKEYNLVDIKASARILFENALFRGNSGTTLLDIDDDNDNIEFRQCRFVNNKTASFCSKIKEFSLSATTFNGNKFKDYSDEKLRTFNLRSNP